MASDVARGGVQKSTDYVFAGVAMAMMSMDAADGALLQTVRWRW